ncbi:RING-H2 finger protein ATL72 [Linum grandiflorum]
MEISIQLHRRRPHQLLLDIQTTIGSPPSPPSTGGGYNKDANFDGDMVIILAALFCALICALGLNSIVRCALRYSWRLAFVDPGGAWMASAATGMKKSALRKIPVVVYGSAAEGSRIVATDCAICLGEFADGEKVRVLPKCNHGFHVRALMLGWFSFVLPDLPADVAGCPGDGGGRWWEYRGHTG